MRKHLLEVYPLLFFFILFYNSYSFSQIPAYCSSDFPHYRFNDPGFKQDHIRSLSRSKDDSNTITYVVPVVFRVVHDKNVPIGQGENLTDQELLQGLTWLNDFFRGVNCPGDTAGLDINIQFCLAKRDIDGNTTSGITRYTTNLTDVRACCDLHLMKEITRSGGNPSHDPFPPTDYISIWVVRSICPDCIPLCDISGLATEGGIISESANFKNCDAAKVLPHEMGHFLGLPHTFDMGCGNGDCLANGDGICDTPPEDMFRINKYDCSRNDRGTKNSCSTDVNSNDPNNPFTEDQQDLQNNFMNYSPAPCRNTFTVGQRFKMRYVLTHPYASLLDSKGCMDTTAAEWEINDTNYRFVPPPVCQNEFPAKLIGGPSKACRGDTIELYTYFECVTPNQWELVRGNGQIISNTGGSIRVVFQNPGNEIITLRVKNVCNSIFYDSLFIEVEPMPTIPPINNENLVCFGELPKLYLKVDSATVYARNIISGAIYPAIGDTINFPRHLSDSCYQIIAEYSSGKCKDEKPYCVKSICSKELVVPSAFTPNEDGLNDYLKPIYYGSPNEIQLVSFKIFNRWGEMVFSTNTLNQGWNGRVQGKLQPSGVFVWILDYRYRGSIQQRKGYSALIH